MEKKSTTSSPKQVTFRSGLLKHQIWNIINENSDMKSKMVRSIKLIYKNYPIRPADGIIVLYIFSFYALLLAFWKNIWPESQRTLYPYKYNKRRYMAFFPWIDERQPKEPFLYKPNEVDFRAVEMYEEYHNNKNNILFKKSQQYDTVLRALRHRVVPSLDHSELDITEFQTLVKINYDRNSLNIIKKNINEEYTSTVKVDNEKLFIKEQLDMEYRLSDYPFKDDLYKELNDLLKI